MPTLDDGFTRVTRPYPSDAPTVVTEWNRACACGHAQHAHDYAGDAYEPAWGVCEIAGCPCRQFEDAE